MAKKNTGYDFNSLNNLISSNAEKNKELSKELEDNINSKVDVIETTNDYKNDNTSDDKQDLLPDKNTGSAAILDNDNSSYKNPDPGPEKRRPGRPTGRKNSVSVNAPRNTGNSILDNLSPPAKKEKYQLPIYFDLPVIDLIEQYSAAYRLSKSEFVNLVMKRTMESFPKLPK